MSLPSVAPPAAALPTPARRYGPARALAIAGGVFLLAYACGIIFQPGEAYLRIQSNLVYNLAPLAALALSVIPISRSRGRERLGWLCLALVLVTWQIGDWTYSYYDLVLNQTTPFPGYADAAYYGGYLAFILAIPLLTFSERRLPDRRWLIDAAVVTLVAGAIAWEYIMKPIVGESGGDDFAAAVALGYPLLDLALLTTLVVTLYASRGKFSKLTLLLTAAGLFQIVTNALYTIVVTTTGYDNVGNPMELGWIAAYLLLAVCFLLPEEESRNETGFIRPSMMGIMLPYALGLPLLALLITSAARGRPSLVLLGGTIGAAALVILRQFLTLRDNLALLVRAANFDDLTGLPNRRRFEEELRRYLPQVRRQGARGALLRLGLDDLKAVNDGVGHSAGDEVIIKVAQVLRQRSPAGAKLARLAGDEFAVLLANTNHREAEQQAEVLLQALRDQPIVLGGQIVHTTASAGVALMPDHGTTVDDLLGRADLAMFEAKKVGGNLAIVYNPQSDNQALSEARLVWKERIRDALEQERFVLYRQPIVELRSGALHQYELLIRMLDEQGDVVPPGMFLDVAERFGLIHEIDRWVLREAVRLLAEQGRRGDSTRLAVNVSGKTFQDDGLLPFIQRELAATGVDPALLIVEVTESAAISDLERAQEFITSLRKLGCRFALDDFGVGFSSLYQLKHLPVDYLKIDGAFIRDLPKDQVDQHDVRAIAGLARGLGRQTIAEFVQDDETVRLLREFGVEYGQGYHLGKPEPVPQLLANDRSVTRQAA
ncbi:MAG: bifunctional diguanylate cyclase/phosphodiesterase [Chloroflexi bacterium]|nr:bifunctional diguanylate cyclase/phosphodiesterase [Chloroflexota bacterium]